MLFFQIIAYIGVFVKQFLKKVHFVYKILILTKITPQNIQGVIYLSEVIMIEHRR